MRFAYFFIIGLFLTNHTLAQFPFTPQFQNNKLPAECIDSTSNSSGMTFVYSIPAGTTRMYLITSNRGMILIDAGWPGFESRVKQLMNRLHRNDLRLILITHGHFDHYGSAKRIRQLTGAPIAIHELDDSFMSEGFNLLGHSNGLGHITGKLISIVHFLSKPEKVFADIMFNDNFDLEPYGIDGYVIHTPGHTPGSCTVILNNEIAFSGDLLCTSGSKILSQQYFAFDWYVLARSLIILKSKAPLRTYPSHGICYISSTDLFKLKPVLLE